MSGLDLTDENGQPDGYLGLELSGGRVYLSATTAETMLPIGIAIAPTDFRAFLRTPGSATFHGGGRIARVNTLDIEVGGQRCKMTFKEQRADDDDDDYGGTFPLETVVRWADLARLRVVAAAVMGAPNC